MITILHGGVSRRPQKWLRNSWTTPNIGMCSGEKYHLVFMQKNILPYIVSMLWKHHMACEHFLIKLYRNALHAIHPIMQSMIESWNTSQILSASYPKSVLEAYFVKFVCTKPNRIRLRFSRRVWPCRPLFCIHPPTHIYGLDARRKGWFTPAHKIDLGK